MIPHPYIIQCSIHGRVQSTYISYIICTEHLELSKVKAACGISWESLLFVCLSGSRSRKSHLICCTAPVSSTRRALAIRQCLFILIYGRTTGTGPHTPVWTGLLLVCYNDAWPCNISLVNTMLYTRRRWALPLADARSVRVTL